MRSRNLEKLEGISAAVKERILCDNPKTLYAL